MTPVLPVFASTLEEMLKMPSTGGAGSSGADGVEIVTLLGNPAEEGAYVQLLKVQPGVKIQSHNHAGDRVATVLKGNWMFGMGTVFDQSDLRVLPPGSVYTEPSGMAHFGMSTDSFIVVLISGYGPTNTVYENHKGK